jgi:glyoxylase-like metal-dependent hydrolase (beta-lactamase superfamily II)
VNRRKILKGALSLLASSQMLKGQRDWTSVRLTDKLDLVESGGINILTFSTGDGEVLVDSGAYHSERELVVPNVRVVFNTHYHLDQTGNNERYAREGAKIIAHERTRQWMATPHWVPAQERYEKARPQMALPTETFLTTGSLNIGSEQIDYGYLLLAHTSGDIYVHFKNANVLVVGDVASPVRDPALDYFTGAWIGGRVDAMDLVLKLSNEQTRIVPAYGPVMTRAEFKAERDLMEEVRARLFTKVREGKGPKEMLEEGLLNGLSRRWEDPYKFLYDAAKGLWAHHDKLDPNVV